MKQKIWLKSLLLLAAAILAAVVFFTVIFRVDNKYTARSPVSEDGWTMVSEKNLLQPAYLADGWELYTDQLLTPSQLAAEDILPIRTFIGEYLNQATFHADRSPYGTATWRLRIRYDGTAANAVLTLPEVFCALRLYVNGKEVAAQGSFHPYQPQIRDTTVSFPLQPETELVVQTANYSHYYGGLTYPPILGTAQSVMDYSHTRMIFYSMLCFGTLAAALFSLAYWLGTRKSRDPVSLLFGILALAFTLWISYPFLQCSATLPVRLPYSIEDGASLLVIWGSLRIAFRLSMISRMLWTRIYSILAFSMVILGVVVPLFLLPVLPAYTVIYGELVTVYRLFAACTLTAVSFCGCLQQKVSGTWMLCGSVFYAVGLMYGAQTISSFEPAQFGWMEEYGALALIVCFGILMIHRSYVLLSENLRLHAHLQEEVTVKTRELSLMIAEREDLMSKYLHDMKSPTAFMLSYIQMVRKNNVLLDEHTRYQLSIMEEKCRAISDQVLQAQQFSVENPLITPHKTLDLCKFLSEFYRFNKPDIEMDGQNFLLQLPKGVCMIQADQDKLNRMLQNLAYNAVSFTPPQGQICLSLTWNDEWANLSLKDTGCGIAPEVLPDIFKHSFTTRACEGGTGMGLYIVNSIAREHGGEVFVQSKPMNGTCFTVRLPLAAEGSPEVSF